jgi:hypothetical protein
VQGGVRAVEIVVMEEEGEAGGAVVTGVVRTSISPLASEGLDEAFGLAVGLGPVRAGKAMLEAEMMAGLGKEFGSIGGAAVGEDALNADAVSVVEVDGLVESGQDAGDLFIGEEGGESQAGMIVDGDMETLDAGAWVAVGTIAGGADAGLMKAAKLFNIKMKELARSGAFVTDDGGLGRVERGEAMEAVALKDAGEGGFGDGKDHEDLGIGTALTAQGEDLGFELGRGLAWLAPRHGGEIIEARREAGSLGAFEPFADGFFADAESGGGGAERRALSEVMSDQFGSHERGESGISVHVDREVWLAVAS